MSRNLGSVAPPGPRADRGSGASPATRGEVGSATVWVLIAASILLMLTIAGVLVGAVFADRQRAQTAADLAALHGAAALVHGTAEPCAQARSIAEANLAALTWCQVVGDNLLVRTAARPPPALARLDLGPATARARAGPDLR